MKKIDTLVIIGNGFDLWQNLNTSYFQFKEYFLSHRDEILEELQISKIKVREDTEEKSITPVEIIYGKSWETDKLEDDFWRYFEFSLGKIDAQYLNLFFDKEEEDLEWMLEMAENARRIFVKAFNDWVGTLNVEDDEDFAEFKKAHGLEDFKFGENCYFINFNYTQTLEKRFSVNEDSVFHIHGQSQDENVIFGHALHPQAPQHELQDFGGRFTGLYNIETLLYETDKHVQTHIMELIFDLSSLAIDISDIKDIYVLGHSLGETDLEYFDFLMDAVSPDRGNRYLDFFKNRVYYDRKEWNEEKLRNVLKRGDSIEEMHRRLQYTIKQYGYRLPGAGYQNYGYQYDEEIFPEEIAAVRKRYGIEQTIANMQLEEQFFSLMEEAFKQGFDAEETLGEIMLSDDFERELLEDIKDGSLRKKEVQWHISCFSDGDRKWAREVMEGLGCRNYQLFSTIDECIFALKETQ